MSVSFVMGPMGQLVMDIKYHSEAASNNTTYLSKIEH